MRYIIILLAAFIFISCSNQSGTIQPINSVTLSDTLFSFQNIEGSETLKKIFLDIKTGIYYKDSTKRKKLVELDSAQKMKLLVPIIKIDPLYVVKYMTAVFVSKETNIGNFTPVTIFVNGDDYSTFFYILVDKNMNIVSNIVLTGGQCAGPDFGEDSTIELCPDKHSFIKGNTISSYIITKHGTIKEVKQLSAFDSINYISTVTSTGKIETKKLDSIRILRTPSWEHP